MTTLRPRAFISRPSDEAVMPFPRLETTPPVTNTYFVTGLKPYQTRRRAHGFPGRGFFAGKAGRAGCWLLIAGC